MTELPPKINDPLWEGEGCSECGNDDGPHRYLDQWWCLDCLEKLHPTTDVLAIDPRAVDPVHLPRLGGLR